jgi:hypothetical protein
MVNGQRRDPEWRPIQFFQVIAPITFLFCSTALAQTDTDLQCRADSETYRRVTTGPLRPNKPLRQENISDEEVREVQRAALEVYPDFIVSISGVSEGCDCEEGINCTAQVWLALYRENQTRSLVLSKIDGHWKIGAEQSWWLEYTAHQASFPGFGRGAKQIAWHQKYQRLLDSYPACQMAPADWTLVRSESHGSTCVDMSSIKVSGSIRRVNFKHVNPPPKHTFSVPWIRYGIDLVAFDCKDRRTRTDEITFYLSDGTAERGAVNDPVLWDPIRPDSVSAADLDLICGWSGK